jgi:hypothetical protein
VPDNTRDGQNFWTPCVPKVREILESSPYNAPAVTEELQTISPPRFFLRGKEEEEEAWSEVHLDLKRSNMTSFDPLTANRNQRPEEHLP